MLQAEEPKTEKERETTVESLDLGILKLKVSDVERRLCNNTCRQDASMLKVQTRSKGDGVTQLAVADSRSKHPRFEPRQEHKKKLLR